MKRSTLITLALAGGMLAACTSASKPATTQRPQAKQAAAPMLLLADTDRAAQPKAQPTQPAPSQPAQQPTLPSGHPDISQMLQQRAAQQAGEPASAGGTPEAPAQPAHPQLPPGHPPLPAESAPAANPQAPAPTPAYPEHAEKPSLFGTLTIQAQPATPNAPAVGGAPVTVELYHNGKVMSQLEAKLDAAGKVVIEDLPLTVAFQPAVKLSHGGIEYEAVGHVMDSNHPRQSLQVAVYEATEEAPAWNVRMQHVMMQATSEGLQVMEMLAIENPTDRAWIGTVDGGARRTFSLPLPAGATNVQLLEGFDECCTRIEGGYIINPKPLNPGTTQYQFAYILPINGGKADLAFTAAAPVKHMMVFVPEDGSTVVAEGLEDMGVSEMKNGQTRFYKAAGLETGQKVALAISGLKPVAVATGASSAANGSAKAAQLVAVGGGLLIFLVGGFFLFIRAPKAAKAA